MTQKPLSAGDPVESHCTKCRTLTNHTIVAMVNNQPVRVECNTCGGQHNYRPQFKPKKALVTRPPAQKSSTSSAWQRLIKESDAQRAVDYSMTTAFEVGAVMAHPKFGLGIVQACLGKGKIDVLFEDGSKKLRCN